jgi:hypothetical protein
LQVIPDVPESERNSWLDKGAKNLDEVVGSLEANAQVRVDTFHAALQ